MILGPFCCIIGTLCCGIYSEAFDCSRVSLTKMCGHIACIISAVISVGMLLLLFLYTVRVGFGGGVGTEQHAGIALFIGIHMAFCFVPCMLISLVCVLLSRLVMRLDKPSLHESSSDEELMSS